jgi:hypothetical protein
MSEITLDIIERAIVIFCGWCAILCIVAGFLKNHPANKAKGGTDDK